MGDRAYSVEGWGELRGEGLPPTSMPRKRDIVPHSFYNCYAYPIELESPSPLPGVREGGNRIPIMHCSRPGWRKREGRCKHFLAIAAYASGRGRESKRLGESSFGRKQGEQTNAPRASIYETS